MRQKSLILMIASIFAIVFVLGFLSATLTFTNVVVPTSANDASGTFQITFDLTNNDIPTSLSWTSSIPTSIAMPTGGDGDPVVNFNVASIASSVTVPVIATVTYTNTYGGPTSQIDLNTVVIYTNNPTAAVLILDTTKPVISITGSNPAYVALSGTYTDAGATATDNYDSTLAITSVSNVNTATVGTYTVTYTSQDSSANQATAKTRTVIVYSNFCAAGSSDTDLALSVDIANKGNGEDNEWQPLDTIESEDEDKFEFGDVDEGDDAKHVFEFRVNPAEFSADGNYKVKIKAYPSGQESTYCIAQSTDLTGFGVSKYDADISINLPSDDEAVVVDESTLPLPATAQCEDEVTFSADIWNIGDTDFEDQIMVTLFNSELGISQNKTIPGDFDQGDMTQVAFTFKVPAGIQEKIYNLDIKTYYKWDADNSEYDEVSTEVFNFPLTLSGKCVPPQLTISASLESGGKAGESLVVKSTIKNTGTEQATYTFALSGYSDWASNAKLNNTLTLAAGQSGEITISLDVDKKAEGDKTFNIDAYSSEGELLKTQPLQVGIEGKQGFDLSDGDSLVP